jgi:hypothetical protein
MSKIFRRSSCQKASDGTNGAYRWHHRTGFGNGPELSICRPSAILQMPETLTQGVSVAQAPDIPSLAVSALSRQIPKVRAVCGNSARAVLCGGRPVMGVPTAIKSLVRRAAPSLARPPARHRRDTGAADAGNVGSNGACISPRLRPSGWPRSCGGPLRGVRRIWPGDGGDWDGSRFPPRPGASVNRPSHERRCRR